MKCKFIIIILLLTCTAYAQETKKNINAKRVINAPKIDGKLDDKAWIGAEVAKDFVMFRPESGTPEENKTKTEVRIVYDDEAIYFGAYLYDDNPDKIPKQFASRDNFGIADWFGVMINPNNDSQNDTEFFVQVTGTQSDAKSNPNDQDFSWSAVWDSQVRIVKDGWIVEIKIPYSALRFSNKEVQTWGLNFHRLHRTSRNQYTWNFIDRKVGSIQQYSGTLSGIENIKPPTRLSFSPYASGTYSNYDGKDSFDNSIGLDLKYGISESFTLDATLIPDFSQTGFDDVVLNLGPFEQQFQEQRPFFTEGTEIFNKGDLVYSRRIGNRPVNYFNESTLGPNEELIKNPDEVDLINAVKVSGRTEKGLGIGFFNAVTKKTEAIIKDLTTDEIRKVVTEPLANYNVLVLDQQFNKNSFVSLTNTNVLRNGSVRDANTTALMYYLSNKENTHNVNGGIKTSRIRENGETTDGYWFDTSVGKSAGKWQYKLGYTMADKNYDINDFGFQRQNDYQNVYASASYRIFEPTKTFRQYQIRTWSNLRYRHSDGAYTGNNFGINFFGQLLSQFAFGGRINGNIGKQYNYFEPRVEGRYFVESPRFNLNGWISTNYSKKFAIDISTFYGTRKPDSETSFDFEIEPRYRFSDKFSMIYEFEYFKGQNQKGYVEELNDGTIIFGNRDRRSVTNSLSGRYNFNTKSSLSLTFRHYWSPVEYDDQYYQLEDDGTLAPNSYTGNNDINYNIWNLDLSYAWEFAPGSQLVAFYRNNIFNADDQSDLDFGENLDNLFEQPKQHVFSLKLIYFIDYNNAKNWFKKT